MRSGDNVCARATTGAAREGCFFTNTPNFNARTTTSTVRMTMSACAWATTSAPVRRWVPRGRGVFSQTPQTSTLGRRCLRPGDNACAQATTSGSYLAFFLLSQSKQNFSIIPFREFPNCVEDGNPKLFLLVGVFLSALNRNLAFLSRHLSI